MDRLRTKKRDMEQKVKKKAKKRSKGLQISGFILGGIQLILSVVLMVMLHFVKIIPVSYMVLAGLLLMLLAALVLVMQRWKIAGILTQFFSVVLSIVLLVGCVYVHATQKTLSQISGETTMTSTVGLYVLSDSGYQKIQDMEGKNCGRLASAYNDKSQELVEHISSDAKISFHYQEYADILSLVGALYEGQVQAIILNTGYLGMLEGTEEYKDFTEKAICIYTKDYVTEVETQQKTDHPELTNEDVTVVYVSGIDTRTGAVTSNGNSDVNILCFINKKTHQILMINTPRDFFIPLSVSGGALDKLTHAGCFGIGCSVDTLGMLYGIKIDYYVKVNFTGFEKIIDELGGINVYSAYDFTSQAGFHYNKGYNYLDGEKALGFARERHSFASGDRQRGKNQMEVIKAVIDKMSSPAMLTNYTGVLGAVSSSIATNMSYDEISKFAQMQLSQAPKWNIQQYSVDGTGDSKTTYSLNMSTYVMIPDEKTVAQAKAYIRQIYDNSTVSVH